MATYGDLGRIGTNVNALAAFNTLTEINQQLSMHQLRLATGNALNSASEDPSSYAIGKDIQGEALRWDQAMANGSYAQDLFNTAETGAESVMGTLNTMSTLVQKASSDLLSTTDRATIQSQLQELASEIDQTVNSTTYRGMHLLAASYSASLSIWLGSTSDATTSKLSFSIHSLASGLNFKSLTGITAGQIDVSTITNASLLLASLITAVAKVDKSALSSIGVYSERLTFKQADLTNADQTSWSSYSKIMDADMAKEQMAVTKYTILQQAAVAGLSQANTAPSFVLTLLGK